VLRTSVAFFFFFFFGLRPQQKIVHRGNRFFFSLFVNVFFVCGLQATRLGKTLKNRGVNK